MRIFLRAILTPLLKRLPWVRRATHWITGWLFGVGVTRMTDVTEVLRDDTKAFSVKGYGNRMRSTVGDFFLGLDDVDPKPRCPHAASSTERSEYCVQWELAKAALPWEDDERVLREEVREIVRREVIKFGRKKKGKPDEHGNQEFELLPEGTPADIEAIWNLGVVVPSLVVERFLGVTDYVDPKRHRLLFRDCDTLSLFLFNPLPLWLPHIVYRWGAKRAGRRLRNEIGRQVRARFEVISGDPGFEPRTTLERILVAEIAACPGSVEERREEILERTTGMMIGLTSGALVAGIRTFASMLDRLMDLPEGVRARIHAAALRTLHGDADKVDRDLKSFVHEASRFGPSPPMLFRVAVKPYVLARGSERERAISKGMLVRFAPARAAMDPWQIEEPREFRLHRPEEEYLHFGHGQHACIGRKMGETMLEEMTAGLFALDNLRRKKPLKSSWNPFRFGRPLRLELEFRVRRKAEYLRHAWDPDDEVDGESLTAVELEPTAVLFEASAAHEAETTAVPVPLIGGLFGLVVTSALPGGLSGGAGFLVATLSTLLAVGAVHLLRPGAAA